MSSSAAALEESKGAKKEGEAPTDVGKRKEAPESTSTIVKELSTPQKENG